MIEGTTRHKEELASPARLDLGKIQKSGIKIAREAIKNRPRIIKSNKPPTTPSPTPSPPDVGSNQTPSEGNNNSVLAFKPSPAKGYGAKAAAHQSGVAGQEFSKSLKKTDTSGKYFKSAGVEGKYPGAPQ
jgi:hypothetical protein